MFMVEFKIFVNSNKTIKQTFCYLKVDRKPRRHTKKQNSENKSYQSILGDPKTVFEPYPNPKNSPLGPQKVKNYPKIK